MSGIAAKGLLVALTAAALLASRPAAAAARVGMLTSQNDAVADRAP